jgi:hypothetical protein
MYFAMCLDIRYIKVTYNLERREYITASGCYVLDMGCSRNGTYRKWFEEMTNLYACIRGCKPYLSYVWLWSGQEITIFC